MSELERIKAAMAAGEHTDGDLAFAVEQWEAALLKLDSRWIPTAERIPEPEVNVLCYGWSELNKKMFIFVDWFGSKRDAGRGVTHWMPLPEPPK